MKRTNFTNRSDFKLSFERPRYNCDPKTNTVTCQLAWTIISPVFIATEKNDNKELTRELYVSPTLGRGVAVGTAVCSTEDAFDKHIGREIAEARAEKAAYIRAGEIINTMFDNVLNFYDTALAKFNYKKEQVVDHNTNYVAQLSNLK